MKAAAKWMALVGTLGQLAGCAMGIGSSEFGCDGGAEEGVRCYSARQIYQMTEDTDRVTPQSAAAHAQGTGSKTAPSAGEEPQAGGVYVFDPSAVAREVPLPVRTPARVMRVWFAPYEDSSGDLHVPGLVYTEIEPRRWTIGEQPPTMANVPFVPLTAPEPARTSPVRTSSDGARGKGREFRPLNTAPANR